MLVSFSAFSNISIETLTPELQNSMSLFQTVGTTVSTTSLIIGFVLLIVGFIALILIEYMLVMSLYLAMDDEYVGNAWDCIKTSVSMMNGHKFEYFVLCLSFVPWVLLSCVTCGLALIYVLPYMQVTQNHYYLQLKKQMI